MLFELKKYFHQKLIVTIIVLGLSWNIKAQEQKKNLLFIITDQQRYDALSLAGNAVLETPNMDRLGREGVYFKNAYTPCAVCGPARASILTGYSIENTGVNSNKETYNYSDSPVMTMPTFDEILTNEGYHCEYYGKWHSLTKKGDVYKNPVRTANNGKSIFGSGGQSHIYKDYLNKNVTTPPFRTGEFKGWANFPYIPDPLDKYYGMTQAQLDAQGLKHSQPDQHGVLRIDQEHTMTAFQAKQTIEAIERLKDKQFSITCSFHFPHAPMLPSEPYYSMFPPEEMVAPFSINDNMNSSPYKTSNSRHKNTEYANPEMLKYMTSNYYGLVKEIDDWVGRILDKLDELGLTENTMVIFTSDHGEMLGAHGMREKNVFYEESAHIPLLIRFPGEIAEETEVEKYISLIDIFSTILDYLKVPESPSNGKSLRGLIEKTDTLHGKYVVTEWTHYSNTPNFMVIKNGWKLILPNSASSTVLNALYDLNTDPYEMINLLVETRDPSQYYDIVEDLRGSLLEWLGKNNSKYVSDVKARVFVDAPYQPTGDVLIERGAEWKYMDDGSDLGSEWSEVLFDDSNWPSGNAFLGFGEGEEPTLLQSGHTTYYFRKSFLIDDISKVKSPLYLDLLCDDGAVVYLNGEELSRKNMPAGEITSSTFASSDVSGSSEFEFKRRLYLIDKIVEGINVVAVEVHQSSAQSNDLTFDLGLEVTTNETTAISDGQISPKNYLLFKAYPNPFNPSTTIEFEIPSVEKLHRTSLLQIKVYDNLGREVKILYSGKINSERHKITFNATELPSGTYFIQLMCGDFQKTIKALLIK